MNDLQDAYDMSNAVAKGGTVVLALNSGSSSFKFGLYQVQAPSSSASGIESLLSDSIDATRAQDAIAGIPDELAKAGLPIPTAIGHRVVHGGPALRQHCVIDDAVLRQLETAAPFAPLHTPTALAVIRAAQRLFPGLPQVACFDTVFHAGMPDVARVLPIPAALQREGIERYGFHGLSCESIVRQLGDNLPTRIIIAHLGNGASITAILRGQSVDTSMGLTPTGGIIMGSRSGDVDPGVLVYLVREKNFDAAMLADLLDHQSGLLGISGVSSDMRHLHDAAPSNANARLAIQMFCASAAKQMAAMITVLDGVDLIVFTGGIGENDALVRTEICRGLSWIGVILDEDLNQVASQDISNARSRCRVRVMASQEDEQIARPTWALMQRQVQTP